MRRFTLVEGTSSKFWEVERDGAEVTVRFGRIGTAGQTKTKDLGSDDAAAAHHDKLVAEKVRKGYAEDGSAPTSPLAQAPAVAATAEAPPPATTTPEPEDQHEIPAEDGWEVPSTWKRDVTPIRGVDPVSPASLDVEAARERVASAAVAAGERLRHRDTPEDLRTAGLAALGEPPKKGLFRRADVADAPTPLGLAVAAVGGILAVDHSDRDPLGRAHLTLWWADHGPETAVLAALELGEVEYYNYYSRQGGVQRQGTTHATRTGPPVAVLALLQRLVAACDDASHAAVVAVLAERRRTADERALAAYLVPDRSDWVADALAQPSPAYVTQLLSIVTSLDAAAALLASPAPWGVSGAWTSLAAHLGPAAAPLLLDHLAHTDAAGASQALRLLSQFRTDEALGGLIARLDTKGVSEHVLVAKERQPYRAARLLAEAAGGRSRGAEALLRSHLAAHPETRAVAPLLTPGARTALDRAVPREDARPVATADQLPALLVEAPWERKRAAVKPVVVDGLVADVRPSVEWLDGERDRWRTPDDDWFASGHNGDWDKTLTRGSGARVELLAAAPYDIGRKHLSRLDAREDHGYAHTSDVAGVLAKYDVEGLDLVMAVTRRSPEHARALLPVSSAEVALLMADWLARSKTVRPVARAWFARHPEIAALALVPPALAKPGRERRGAERALRYVAAQDRAAVERAVASYGPAAAAAVDAMLAVDPVDVLPARVPALPAWLDTHALPAVLLAGRAARLPREAVVRLLTGLSVSEPGEPWAGIELVQPALDAPSVAECAWAVVEMWRLAGEPAKDTWVLGALALVGDDESARRLSPLIAAWPKQGGTSKANLGIEVLAALGTDVALLHLHRLSLRASSLPLREKAGALIQRVADELELTAEQLADRLVPDLGLDPDGRLVLDYGPRQFMVGFDEALKPYVEEDGKRRPTLPKPGAKDDPELADASYALFAGLKKDVRTVATDQLRRCEQAMAAQRRWSAADQRALFVEHPLMWHLARRVVWAVFEDGRPVASFRVAEDRTLADRDDEQLELADDATVGIAHPLHLGDDIGTWSELFADYEVLQPFPQLGREVLRLTPEELRGSVITRFATARVETKKLYGLAHRGWERTGAEDGGVQSSLEKQLPGDLVAIVTLDPGIIVGMPDEWPEQTLEQVYVAPAGASRWDSRSAVPLSDLDDVTASEILRDLTRVAGG